MSARHLPWAGNQFSLLPPWQVCLSLASVPTYLASHTETKKSFLFSSHLSCFLKKVLEFYLHSLVGSVVLLCFLYFKNYSLFSCVIFLSVFFLLVLLFSFGVFISSAFTTFDYKRTLLSHLRTTIDLNGFRYSWNILSFVFRQVWWWLAVFPSHSIR